MSICYALRAGADGYLLKGHSPEELRDFLIDAASGTLALSFNIALSILALLRSSRAPDND
jgi:DNA-binding NarL/FixJ family response regulator